MLKSDFQGGGGGVHVHVPLQIIFNMIIWNFSEQNHAHLYQMHNIM